MSSTNPLSDVLRSVRLRGAAFFYVSCGEEWVSVAPPSSMVGPTVMPGSEHVIAYHLMVRGDGWAAVDGEAPIRFTTGDVVLMLGVATAIRCRVRPACCPSRTTAPGSFACATTRSRFR